MKSRELRTNLLIGRLREMYKNERSEPIINVAKLQVRKVLVICPHADDEIVGCGGAIIHFSKKKKVEVHVLVCTKESTRSIAKSYAFNPMHRVRESYQAKEIMGYQHLHYFNFPELGFNGRPGNKKKLEVQLNEFIQGLRPDCIFVPNSEEMHPDHRVIGGLMNNIIHEGKKKGQFDFIRYVLIYEVWGPVKMNSYFQISKSAKTKMENGMSCYRSQMASVDYKRIIEFLGNQRRQKFNQFNTHIKGFKKTLIEGYTLIQNDNF